MPWRGPIAIPGGGRDETQFAKGRLKKGVGWVNHKAGQQKNPFQPRVMCGRRLPDATTRQASKKVRSMPQGGPAKNRFRPRVVWGWSGVDTTRRASKKIGFGQGFRRGSFEDGAGWCHKAGQPKKTISAKCRWRTRFGTHVLHVATELQCHGASAFFCAPGTMELVVPTLIMHW